LDQIEIAGRRFEFLKTYSPFLEIIFTGKRGKVYRDRLVEAEVYLMNWSFPERNDREFFREEKLVHLNNNLAELEDEINGTLQSKTHPWEPSDFFEEICKRQGIKPSFRDLWNSASEEHKQWCQNLSNKMRSFGGQNIPCLTKPFTKEMESQGPVSSAKVVPEGRPQEQSPV